MKRANIIILLLISVIAFGCGQVIKQNAIDNGPTISYITPTTGDRNTVITVAGRGFGDERGNSNVYYANQKLTPESWSNTLINVRLYDTTLTNNPSGRFRVEVDGTFSNESPQTFNSGDQAGIAGISPSEGSLGTLVTITLASTPVTQPEYATFFELNNPGNQVRANLHKLGDNRYYCNVPNLTNLNGASTVGVQVGYYNSNGITMYFKYIAPSAGNLSKTSGTIGETITIYGSGFGGNQNTYNSSLYMSGTYLTPTAWSDQAISFRVPNISSAGSKTITLRANGTDTNLGTFELCAPIITSHIVNTTNKNTRTVTLYGSYFSTPNDLSAVNAAGHLNYVGGTANISISSWTNNYITFTWEGTYAITVKISISNLESNGVALTP